jgi:hypothetical protein
VLKGTSIGENLRDIRRRVLREWSTDQGGGKRRRALAGCTPGAVSIKAKNNFLSEFRRWLCDAKHENSLLS